MITLRSLIALTWVAATGLGPAAAVEPAQKQGTAAEEREAELSKLMGLMREKLPPGWTMTYLKDWPLLEFKRTEEALVYGESVALPSAPRDKASWPSSRQSIGFQMRVRPFPSQAVLDHVAANNAPAKLKMAELKDRLEALRKSYETNPALREKGEDVAVLKEYQALRDGLMSVSQFSFRGVMMLDHYGFCGLTPPLEPRIVDEGVRAEYRKVCEAMEGLLTRFCPEKPPLLR